MITLLDANHCPGSVMFLIEGKRGIVLHSGDIRAEPAAISQVVQNIHIAPYLFTESQQRKKLEAVYLDTASFIGTQVVPSKGLDWACLPGVFAESLSSDGYETLRRSTLDGLKQLFPGIDLMPEGMEKRMERVLSKSGHPDVEHENAFGSDEVEWTEARLQRVKKTKEHIETYLLWLFGRRDTPTLAVAVNTFPAITSPTTTPAVDSDSSNNMFKATLETLAQLHTTLKNSETSLGPRLTIIDSCRPHIVIPTRTAGGSLNRRLIQNTDHWRGNATTTSTNTSSSTATSQTPVTFAESDARERRRISKLKERDIRAQLAKLPPGFSKALVETKSKSGSQ
ncbi:hypothetical protein RhiXN_01659 [Rhizoctonia solani]|uniref:Uncharacterized protein n=1 Tax=Rhizoctonia solani TaxID=456999 RepID=A0A8H8P7P7_9AGAM|nr:uncharacterized protein RhiXN_01659 [Rhizoctonia solani]QRW27064.1 hypothetical protein RhiXN_01659 [Rhizoctonia solani]